MKNADRIELLNLADIEVFPWVEREPMAGPDERDGKSIEEYGILEPLIVVQEDGRTLLVKGSRRRRLALKRGVLKGPCIIDEIPAGMSAEQYIRKVRFILHQHRQDPEPTVRAALVHEMMRELGLTQKDVARMVDVEEDTVGAWMLVRDIKPREILNAIDRGELSLTTAKIFRGLNAAGQRRIWKRHKSELTGPASEDAAKRVLAMYPPSKFGELYLNPDKALKRVKTARKQAKKAAPKVSYSDQEKRRMLVSNELKADEIEDRQVNNRWMEEANTLCGPLCAAFTRDKELREEVAAFVRDRKLGDDAREQILFELESHAESWA